MTDNTAAPDQGIAITPTPASLRAEDRQLLQLAEQQINQVIVGKAPVVRLALCCLLAGGVGKTTLAHAFAKTFALDFKRVQFTADLMPSDLVGVSVYRRSNEQFEFVPGPLFTQILLADELNRGSAKTQSALLEAMAEAQITVDGQTRALHDPFFVIATQNPREQAGTFALPESQLDRFMMSLSLGYPDPNYERELLVGQSRKQLLAGLGAIINEAALMSIRQRLAAIKCSGALIDYVQRLIAASRDAPEVRYGLSPRGALALVAAARAYAGLAGRDYVIPEDVQAVFAAVCAHRLTLSQSQASASQVAQALLKRVRVV
jgi:MoxR-like ATPase